MEARVGIEPTHKGFADLSLTTWVPRRYHFRCYSPANSKPLAGRGFELVCSCICRLKLEENLERETGVEPATSTLARSHSTTELLPLGVEIINYATSRDPLNH